MVDPDAPSITCWRLRDGEYVEVASAEGDDVAAVSEPFSIQLRPAELVL